MNKDYSLTCDELADLYNIITKKDARRKPLQEIYNWAIHHDMFFIDKDGFFYFKGDPRFNIVEF